MTIQDTFKTSLWMHTAVPAPDTKKLNINCSTEVVIVGAGFTGLSAALHLSEMGCKVTVLEAEEIGFGASGRNGGQVNPGLKIDPDVLLNRFGVKKASHIFSATESSADFVFDLVKRYNLNCELKRTGFIYASENKNMLNKSRLRVEWLKKIGVKAKLLDANETAERIGHQIYSGSIYDPRGGALNPLSYVRELASAALTKGVKIGLLFLSTGVGTVTMYIFAEAISFASALGSRPFFVDDSSSVLFINTFCKLSGETSKVWSSPDLSSCTLPTLISNPMTLYFLANSTAKGRPT